MDSPQDVALDDAALAEEEPVDLEAAEALAEAAKRRRLRTLPARCQVLQNRMARKVVAAEAKAAALSEQLAMVTTLAQDARQILPIQGKFADRAVAEFTQMWAFQRLACGPTRKGAQLIRQLMAAELVGNAALHLQSLSMATYTRFFHPD